MMLAACNISLIMSQMTPSCGIGLIQAKDFPGKFGFRKILSCESRAGSARIKQPSSHDDQLGFTKWEAMDVENVLCMKGGVEQTSYANSSLLQKHAILKMRPILKDSVKDMVSTNDFPTCIKAADLGCSSGPNTLLVISDVVETIDGMYQEMNYESPEFQVFLNDLPSNDFNTIFKSLPAFYKKLKKEKGEKLGRSFISGQPGSFYGRLFPSKSLHFVHASNSVHWLSQVPKGISNNKGNIFMAKSSPPSVLRAYMEQFHRDFSNFLSLRGEEIMPGGRMLLTITGRSVQDPTCNDSCKHWELLGKSLMDLAAEGLVEEKDVDSFNLPIYRPYGGEVSEIIQEEGSFGIEGLETFELNWDPNDNIENQDFVFNKNSSGRNVADWTRAGTEPILASHFGGAINIMDRLFARFAENVAEHLCLEKTKLLFIVVSLSKK